MMIKDIIKFNYIKAFKKACKSAKTLDNPSAVIPSVHIVYGDMIITIYVHNAIFASKSHGMEIITHNDNIQAVDNIELTRDEWDDLTNTYRECYKALKVQEDEAKRNVRLKSREAISKYVSQE